MAWRELVLTDANAELLVFTTADLRWQPLVSDDPDGAPTGHRERLAFCLDTQHLFASGYPVHEEGGIERVLEEFDAVVGLSRLRCLHVNDSKVAFGSNRDRHENLGDGAIGAEGLRRILGHPALQGLPAILEVPGVDGNGADAENVARAKRLHDDGVAARGRRPPPVPAPANLRRRAGVAQR